LGGGEKSRYSEATIKVKQSKEQENREREERERERVSEEIKR
jgi:hypothetical protein